MNFSLVTPIVHCEGGEGRVRGGIHGWELHSENGDIRDEYAPRYENLWSIE
jgi:hypothetical protein